MKNSLKEFEEETIGEINSGLPKDFEISDEIKFDVSVTTTASKGGKLNIKLASGNIEKDNQVTHKISFGVVNAKQKEMNLNHTANTVIAIVKKGIAELGTVLAPMDINPSLIEDLERENGVEKIDK